MISVILFLRIFLIESIYLLPVLLFFYPNFSFADCNYDSHGLSVDFTSQPPVLIASEERVEDVEEKQKNTYYYQLDIKEWKLVKELTKEEYDKLPKIILNDKKLEFFGKGDAKPFFVSSDGVKFTFNARECELSADEGGPYCKKLDVNFNEKTLVVDCKSLDKSGCSTLSEIDQWGEQIWLALSVQGECSDHGAGLAVFDKKTLKKLYSSPINKGYAFVSKILPLDKENQIWVFSDQGLDVFNKKFEILRHCQFIPTSNYATHSVKCEIVKDEKTSKPKK